MAQANRHYLPNRVWHLVQAAMALVLLGPFLTGGGCGGGGGSSSGGSSNPPPIPPSFSVDDWQWRNPLPQGNDLRDVIDIGGTYDVVGTSGTIYNFSNGLVFSEPLLELYGVASGNGVVMAVGSGSAILTSQDGTNWTINDPYTPPYFGYRGIAYGNGTFVAFGLGAVYTTHNNGNMWSFHQLLAPLSGWIINVEFLNNQFVGVSDGDTIYTSPDGDTWTQGSIPNLAQLAVTYGQGQYVGVSKFGSVYSSPDALNWTFLGGIDTSLIMKGVAFGNGMYVAVGSHGGGGIYFSPDAVTWTHYLDADDNNFYRVRFINGQFVAVGDGGQIAVSADGVAWTNVTSRVTALPFLSVAYGNNQFLAAAYDQYTTFARALISSPDGAVWTEQSPLPNNEPAYRVKFMDGLFYAFCTDAIYSSTDGTSWSTVVSVPNSSFNDFLYADGLYVAIGGNQSKILTSPDETTWTERWSGSGTVGFTRVIYAQNLFVALTGFSTVYISPDGMAWSPVNTNIGDMFIDITFGNGQYVAIGYHGTIISSPDGVKWTRRVYGSYGFLATVLYTPDGFVAAGTFTPDFGLGPVTTGQLYTSLDGITWLQELLPVDSNLYGLAYGGGGYLVAGYRGVILQSSTVTFHPGSP